MYLTVLLVAVAAAAVFVAARQRTVIDAQRRLLAATQALTATMTPTQSTHDVAETLNAGDSIMATVGHRGVTVGLLVDKNTRYGASGPVGRPVRTATDGLSVQEHADQAISLFRDRS